MKLSLTKLVRFIVMLCPWWLPVQAAGAASFDDRAATLRQNPEDPTALRAVAAALHAAAQGPAGRVKQLTGRWLAQDDGTTSRLTLGEALLRAGLAAAAQEQFQAAAQQEPHKAAAQIGLGRARLAAYDFEAALAAADEAQALAPEDAAANILKAQVLLALDRVDEALLEAESAVQMAPNSALAQATLGQVYLWLEDQEEVAEESFRRALELDPDCPEAVYGFGVLYERWERFKEAQAQWRRYLALDPYSDRARRLRLGVEPIQRTAVSEWATYMGDWSPDGDQIVYAQWKSGVFIASVDGPAEGLPVHATGETVTLPDWSPDGNKILWEQWPPEGQPAPYAIWLGTPDGPGQATVLVDNLADTPHPHWSPDGSQILYCGREGGRMTTFLCQPDGRQRRPAPLPSLRDYTHYYSNWLPDGQGIACALQQSNWEHALAVARFGEREARFLVPFAPVIIRDLDVSPEGQRLVYAQGQREDFSHWNLWVAPMDGSDEPVRLFTLNAPYPPHPRWSPDGRRIAFNYFPGSSLGYLTLGGQRPVVTLNLSTDQPENVFYGTQIEAVWKVALRNLSAAPQAVQVEVVVTEPEGDLTDTQKRDLNLAARAEERLTFRLTPGREGNFQVTARATGEAFAEERQLTFQIVRAFAERTRVAVLPLEDPYRIGDEAQWAGAAVWDLLVWRLKEVRDLVVPSPELTAARMFGFPNETHSYTIVAGPDGTRVQRLQMGPEEIPWGQFEAETVAKIAERFRHSQFVIAGRLELGENEGWRLQLHRIDVDNKALVPDWDITLEGQADALLTLPGELARQICAALGVTLAPETTERLVRPAAANLEALRAYGQALVYARPAPYAAGGPKVTDRLQKALQADPLFVEAHVALGQAYERTGSSDKALTEYRLARSMDPTCLVAAESLLRRYSWSEPEREELLALLLAHDPHHAMVHYLRAQQHVRRQQWTAAAAELEQAAQEGYFADANRREFDRLGRQIYAAAPGTDPRFQKPVAAEFENTSVREVLAALTQAAGFPLVAAAPDLATRRVTLHLGETTVGAVMEELVEQVDGQWEWTENGYFLMERGK